MTKKQPRIWSGKLDGYLKKNLDQAKKVIKKDWDMIFIVDGYEGAGKSVLAQQCAKYLDLSFNVDRICFTPKDFVDTINKCNKFEALIYDEAYGGMSSRAAMSEVNKGLMSVLAEIRQKNLFVFIVLPCFFELDKYAAIWRSRALLHVYTGDNFERGRFAFYSQERKKVLYVLGKKFYSYKKPHANFFGSFSSGYSVPEDEYRQKKLDVLRARSEEPVERESAMKKKLYDSLARCVFYMMKTDKLTAKEIGEISNLSKSNIYFYTKRAHALGLQV